MRKNYIYEVNGIVRFSTPGMKTSIKSRNFYRCGDFYGSIFRGLSLGAPCCSLVSLHFRYYSTNTNVIAANSPVKIEPAVIYLNADTQKLAIIYDNKNKAGGIQMN